MPIYKASIVIHYSLLRNVKLPPLHRNDCTSSIPYFSIRNSKIWDLRQFPTFNMHLWLSKIPVIGNKGDSSTIEKTNRNGEN